MADDVPPKWHGQEYKEMKVCMGPDFESEAINASLTRTAEEVVLTEVLNYRSGIFVGPLGKTLSLQNEHPIGTLLNKLQQTGIHLVMSLTWEQEHPGYARLKKIATSVKLCAGLFIEAADDVRSIFNLTLYTSEANEAAFHEAMRSTSTVAHTMNSRYHSLFMDTGFTMSRWIRIKLASFLDLLNFNLHQGTELGAAPIQHSVRMFEVLQFVSQLIYIVRFPAPDRESLLAVISFWNAPNRRFRHELGNHLVSEETANQFPSCWESCVNKHLKPWR